MKRILVVDDSGTVRELLYLLLTENGYTVSLSDNGIDGVKSFIQTNGCDMIISDINMPAMDGLTMCENIRKIGGMNQPIVLISSTEFSYEMKQRGKELGVSAWLMKPIHPDKLLMALDKLLGK